MANNKSKQKINPPAGFDDLAAAFSEVAPSTEKMAMDQLIPDNKAVNSNDENSTHQPNTVENQEPKVVTAATGCKEGSTRKTYILTYEIISKIKAVAGYFNRPEYSIVQELLESGVEAYEKKYGEQVSNRNRSL